MKKKAVNTVPCLSLNIKNEGLNENCVTIYEIRRQLIQCPVCLSKSENEGLNEKCVTI